MVVFVAAISQVLGELLLPSLSEISGVLLKADNIRLIFEYEVPYGIYSGLWVFVATMAKQLQVVGKHSHVSRLSLFRIAFHSPLKQRAEVWRSKQQAHGGN